MNQLTLFDSPPAIVRKSDPATSQQAAKEMEPKLSSAQAAMRMMIDRSTIPHTAQELVLYREMIFLLCDMGSRGGLLESERAPAPLQ